MMTSSSAPMVAQVTSQEVIVKIEDLVKTIVKNFAESGDCIIKTPTGNIRFHSQSSITFGIVLIIMFLLLYLLQQPACLVC